MLPRPSGTIALLTDFGTRDPFVGVLKGVMLRAAPRAVLVDVCHEVPPQDVATGALFLQACCGRFPAGTVFVAVVDPGVGTARRALAVLRGDAFYLGPDNGLLTPVLGDATEVRQLDLAHLGLQPQSRTFHGRDVFAPVAAWLAGGRFGFTALGPRCEDPVRLPAAATAAVVHVDTYGNLMTSVTAAAAAQARAVRIAGREAELVATYAERPAGSLVALVNSYDLVEIAVTEGSAAAVLGVGRGTPVHLLARANPS